MNRREFVTAVLDAPQKADVISTIVAFLASKGVETVKAVFGFAIERDLRGEKQGEDAVVPLVDLRQFIERGLSEGTIEWSRGSDFRFSPVGMDLEVMLCNDSDLHFSSPNLVLLMELSRALSGRGVKVYESGKLVSADDWR